MSSKIEPFRAYWPDRTPQLGICIVKEINFEEQNACISNGIVRVYPLLNQIQLIRPTGIPDVDENQIYEFDYVEDDKNIYLVEWNQQQTALWLKPVKSKTGEDIFFMVCNNQTLGDGNLKRRDLKIIGNKFTTDINKL
jgi:hypothetical protein